MLENRGEIDEALRINRDECIPVYERLNDMHQKAVMMGRIADILEQRGQTDEALRIRREEELPVYERLGDVRAKAVMMGRIADILEQRGETDEALRIRREEQLPVYDRLGDVRSKIMCRANIGIMLMNRSARTKAVRGGPRAFALGAHDGRETPVCRGGEDARDRDAIVWRERLTSPLNSGTLYGDPNKKGESYHDSPFLRFNAICRYFFSSFFGSAGFGAIPVAPPAPFSSVSIAFGGATSGAV